VLDGASPIHFFADGSLPGRPIERTVGAPGAP
jgi:hypothetical protein